jgi:hypothetical protein
MNFAAIATVVAVKILQLRDLSRAPHPTPASEVLNPVQLTILRKTHPKLGDSCTVTEALRAIATMGGFVGSNRDAKPGWRTIWRGFMKLLSQEEGYRLAMDNLAHSTIINAQVSFFPVFLKSLCLASSLQTACLRQAMLRYGAGVSQRLRVDYARPQNRISCPAADSPA